MFCFFPCLLCVVPLDHIHHHGSSNHAVIYHRGRFFRLHGYHRGVLLKPADLEKYGLFKFIYYLLFSVTFSAACYDACSVSACNFCTEINLFVCASFRVFSLNFEGDKLSPWPFFKGTIPIAVRDWRNGAAWLKPWFKYVFTVFFFLPSMFEHAFISFH